MTNNNNLFSTSMFVVLMCECGKVETLNILDMIEKHWKCRLQGLRIGTDIFNSFLSKNRHKCVCGDHYMHIVSIDADVHEEYAFNITKNVMNDDNRGFDNEYKTLITWFCEDCHYMWDTTEVFDNYSHKRFMLQFLALNKSCPKCKRNDITVHKEVSKTQL